MVVSFAAGFKSKKLREFVAEEKESEEENINL